MHRFVKLNIAVCLVLILMIAVARAQQLSRYDLWGNRYPDACMQDLAGTPALIWFDQDLGYWPNGKKTIGLFLKSHSRGDVPGTILIDRSIREANIQKEVLRHEQCHNYLWITTGNPNWHPE